MTYSEKLKDPRWQKKRLEILNRDEFTCQMCLDKESTLHVHHGYYEKNYNPWDYDSNTLHTVCENCHLEIEGVKRDLHMEMARIPPLFLHELMGDILNIQQNIISNGKKIY